jgi:CheY-like chemotaxis protein
MPDDRDKHQLGKIALRRRLGVSSPGGEPSSADGVPPSSSSSAPPGPPGPPVVRDEMDDMFDRSFEATFQPTPGPEPAPAAVPPRGTARLRQSVTDIEVDIGEPVSESEAAAAGGSSPRAEFLRTLAHDTGVPAIDLDRVSADLTQLDLLPREVALRNLLVPLCVREGRLFVAIADPHQRRALDELEFVSGLRVVPHVAPHSQVRQFVEACYRAHAAGQRTYGRPGSLPLGQLEAITVQASEPPADTGDLRRTPITTVPIDLDRGLPGPAAPAPAVEAAPRQRRRVLVVDDEADIRTLVVRVLRDKGYEVLEAAQGAEALRMVQAQLPDLLVLDAMLPEIHGFDVCRRIKSSPRYKHIPVIMISAIYRGWRFAADLKKSYGVDHFLEKPFKIADLIDRVTQLLSGQATSPPATRELSSQAQAELAAGVQAARAGDLAGAIRHLQRGLEADPLSHQLHYQLGTLYGKQGQIYQAIQALESALEIEPGDYATLRGLGQLYEHAGFPCKAVEMWERAAGVSPDEASRSSIKEHLLKLL